MISIGELILIAVYTAMAGYIVYLQHKRRKAEDQANNLTLLLHGVAIGEVTIEVHNHGYNIIRTDSPDRKVPGYQHRT